MPYTSYKALLKLIACDDENREHVIGQCDKCPDDSELKSFLCELQQGFDEISFK